MAKNVPIPREGGNEMDHRIRYRALGPLSVRRAGREVELGWHKQQSVLATLLVEMNRPVPVATIIEAVWHGGQMPRDARNAVQTYVSRLRRLLEPDRGVGWPGRVLVSTGSGYLLRGDPALVDLEMFERHLVGAQKRYQHGDLPAAGTQLDTALRLWQGHPFTGLDGPVVEAQRRRFGDLHLTARELRAQISIDRGRTTEAIAELRDLVAVNPGREHLWALLMLSLYRASRQAEALAVFQDVRRRLADELGIDPGPELRELHERILRGDVGPARSTLTKRFVRRNDLPADVVDFTGRQREVLCVLGDLPDAGHARATGTGAATVQVIDGMAGVGKTALAVHLAHRLAWNYPDAQLYLDLHGHTHGRGPLDSSTALENLLRALSVPAAVIPDGLDGRAALWRAELAARRVLVVLDNAFDTTQVRPLLPGTARCLALVTSRHRLAELEGAGHLSLDPLSPSQASALFARIVGEERAVAERDAVQEVARLCGYLPLAIRNAAVKLRNRPVWTIGYLADRLRDGKRRLAELTTGDRGVAAAFGVSYRNLTTAQQRMFRLLGTCPDRDFDTGTAAALAGVGLETAGALLEDLVDAHMLQEPVPGRYRFLDLMRQYAASLGRGIEPASGQEVLIVPAPRPTSSTS
ncbi:AfsR/SARP family transcriptional regulator [Amycolatopsis pigmentata]|uniref:BTAD domain-containing putative transcriptional regulator n=1 Tax=Amycolatopsis pigmentata TaxID=450801 RepID=A0ABW5FL59_9PSEU